MVIDLIRFLLIHFFSQC